MDQVINGNFNFFDQFGSTEVDLTNYLANFSTDQYNISLSSLQPVKVSLTNLFDQYRFFLDFKNSITSIQEYLVRDGDGPERVSYRLYGTTDFWWVILIFNNIVNPFGEWPISQTQLHDLVNYLVETERLYSPQKYFELLFEQNEKRRQIVVPTSSALYEIIWQYRQKVLERT